MKPSLFAAMVLAAATLSACETATPYQPLMAGGMRASGGYFDHQIEVNRWQVGFKGNDATPRATVERYLLFRSAQLTLSQGYDWFEAVRRATDKKTEVYSDPDPFFYGPRLHRHWGYGWGYGYWGGPYWGPGFVDYSQTNRYEATAEIVLGRGPKPNDRQAFDARSVVEHLGPAIGPTRG